METRITLPFADGEDHDFWLPMPRVIAVEREAECSIFALFHDLGENLGQKDGQLVLSGPSPARLKACHSLIRNALVGAGAPEQTARDLVETYCYPARPAMQDIGLAWQVLRAAVYGVQLPAGSKKKDAAAEQPSPS